MNLPAIANSQSPIAKQFELDEESRFGIGTSLRSGGDEGVEEAGGSWRALFLFETACIGTINLPAIANSQSPIAKQFELDEEGADEEAEAGGSWRALFLFETACIGTTNLPAIANSQSPIAKQFELDEEEESRFGIGTSLCSGEDEAEDENLPSLGSFGKAGEDGRNSPAGMPALPGAWRAFTFFDARWDLEPRGITIKIKIKIKSMVHGDMADTACRNQAE